MTVVASVTPWLAFMVQRNISLGVELHHLVHQNLTIYLIPQFLPQSTQSVKHIYMKKQKTKRGGER